MTKSLLTFCFCGIAALSVNAQSEINFSFSEESPQRMLMRISDNQKYAVGTDSYKIVFIWNLETGDVSTYPSADPDLSLKAEDITNDGIVVGNHLSKPGVLRDGVWEELPLTGESINGYPLSVTPDGSKIAGYVSKQDYTTQPAVWENGECRILDYPLSVEGFGDVLQARVKDMSADGTILVGNLYDRFSMQVGCVWRAPLFECEVYGAEAIGTDYYNCFAARISNNGEWVTGPIISLEGNINYCYRYNIKEDVFEMISDLEALNGGACINNAGTIFCYTHSGTIPMWNRVPHIQRIGEKSIPLFDHMLNDFGIDMTSMSKTCTVMDVSSGEDMFGGFGMDESNLIMGFVVTNKIADGFKKIEYKEDGMVFKNNILTVSAKDADIYIYSSTGKLIRKSTQKSVDLNNAQPGIYIVTALLDGETVCKKIIIK